MRGVKATNVERRLWIADVRTCPALNQDQIVHVGIIYATAPTRILRTKQTTTYFLACFGGRGKVLINGRWRTCGKGSACLLPQPATTDEAVLPPLSHCWNDALPLVRTFVAESSPSWRPVAEAL